MVRVITQQTFNDVVRENMDDFGLSMADAIEEAIKQFEAQGVDLSNIIKGIDQRPDSDPVLISLGKLKVSDDNEEILANLKILQEECLKEVAKKVFAGKEGAYVVLLELLDKHKDNKDIQISVYQTLLALMTGYPDLLDDKGVSHMVAVISKSKDLELLKCVLKWCRVCCIKHEKNREMIFNTYIVKNFKQLLETTLVKEVCGAIRSLCLDDDIRVQVSQAHEHARGLAIDLLCPLASSLARASDSDEDSIEILKTLSTLIVRDEFCVKADEIGVLNKIVDVVSRYDSNEEVVRSCLTLLKALAGNDKVKEHIVQNTTLITLIMHSIEKHESKAACCAAGLGMIAALSLRSPTNSKTLIDLNAAEIIVTAMRLHPDNANVLMRGCWAVRNMVSRNGQLSNEFLKLGIEEILLNTLKRHKRCTDDAKAALRDLRCDIKLTEQWTGKGVQLQNC